MSQPECSARQIPARFVLHTTPGNSAVLCCPVCGFECVHPLAVTVEQGHTRTDVQRQGTTVAPTDRGCYARGSLVELRFACEEGHEFRYRLEFHKGGMFVELAAQSCDPRRPFDELWRN